MFKLKKFWLKKKGHKQTTNEQTGSRNFLTESELSRIDLKQSYSGWVDMYYADKGFGFIKCPALPKQIFVHYSDIHLKGRKYLVRSQKITFDIVLVNSQLQAVNVKPIELTPMQKAEGNAC